MNEQLKPVKLPDGMLGNSYDKRRKDQQERAAIGRQQVAEKIERYSRELAEFEAQRLEAEKAILSQQNDISIDLLYYRYLQDALRGHEHAGGSIPGLIEAVHGDAFEDCVNPVTMTVNENKLKTTIFKTAQRMASFDLLDAQHKGIPVDTVSLEQVVDRLQVNLDFYNKRENIDPAKQSIAMANQSPAAQYLLYGNSVTGEFSSSQNLSDSVQIQNLMENSLYYLESIDPILARHIKSDMRVVVSDMLFHPDMPSFTQRLIEQSRKTKMLFIEKSVYEYAVAISATRPDIAMRIIAASLAHAGQLLYRSAQPMVNFNTMTAEQVYPLIVRISKEKGIRIDTDEMKRVAQGLIKYRDSQSAPVSEISQMDTLASIPQLRNYPTLTAGIQPYFVFSVDQTGLQSVAMNKATLVLGSNYKNFRDMVILDAGFSVDDINYNEQPTSLSGILTNQKISTQERYNRFIGSVFANNMLFDSIQQRIAGFDESSDAAAYVALVSDLQNLVDNHVRKVELALKNAVVSIGKDGQRLYTISLPNGRRVKVKETTYKGFGLRFRSIAHSIRVYYDPAVGIGLQFASPSNKVMQLSPLVSSVGIQSELNRILDIGRERSFDAIKGMGSITPYLTSIVNPVRGLDLFDVDASTQNQRFIAEQKNASECKQQFDALSTWLNKTETKQWQQLSLSERKGLAALILVDNDIPLQWINFVSGIYDSSAPITITQRVQNMFEQYASASSDMIDINIILEVLSITGSQQWDVLSARQKQSVFQALLEKYRSELDQAHYEQLNSFLKSLDPVVVRVLHPITAQTLGTLWDFSRQRIAASSDPNFIKQETIRMLGLIDQARLQFDKKQETPEILAEKTALNQLESLIGKARVEKAVELLDNFNDRYAGVVNLDVSRSFIIDQPDVALDYLAQVYTSVEIDQDANPLAYQLKGYLDRYTQARTLWNSGKRTEAHKVLSSVVDELKPFVASNTFVLLGSMAIQQFEVDIESLEAIMTGKEALNDLDMFNGMDALLKELLKQLPADQIIQGLLAYPDFVMSNIFPQAGVTELVLRLKPAGSQLVASEEGASYDREMFNESGISFNDRIIFLDAGKATQGSSSFLETQKGIVFDALLERNNTLTRQLDTLSYSGFPINGNLLRFSKRVDTLLDTADDLGNGYSVAPLLLESEDLGVSIPVAMHPQQFAAIKNHQMKMFDLLQTYLRQAAYFTYQQPRPALADSLLEKANQLVNNLTLFSPVIRNNLLFAIERDKEAVQALRKPKPVSTKAVLIHKNIHSNVQISPSVTQNAALTRVINGAFDDLANTVSSDFAQNVKKQFNIVVGQRPRENIPPNTLYISNNFYDMLMRLASNKSTVSYASVLLARQLFNAYHNRPRLLSGMVLSGMTEGENTPDRFLLPIQITKDELTDDFSGEVVMPLDIAYDNHGRPYPNLNGPQTVTVFRGGAPVQVIDRTKRLSQLSNTTGRRLASAGVLFSSDDSQKEVVFPLSTLAETVHDAGFRTVVNQNGSVVGLELLSNLERWIGPIEPADDSFYFIKKGNAVLAMVKSSPDTDTIYPLQSLQELQRILNVESTEDITIRLQDLASQRRAMIKRMEQQEARTLQTPRSGKAAQTVINFVLLATVLGGVFSGCGGPDDNTHNNAPTATPASIDQLPFVQFLDQYDAGLPVLMDQQTQLENIALLDQVRDDLEDQLAALGKWRAGYIVAG